MLAFLISQTLHFNHNGGWEGEINMIGGKPFTVMDKERGIAVFPHSFKEYRTNIKVVWHYIPLKILIEHYCYSQPKDDESF